MSVGGAGKFCNAFLAVGNFDAVKEPQVSRACDRDQVISNTVGGDLLPAANEVQMIDFIAKLSRQVNKASLLPIDHLRDLGLIPLLVGTNLCCFRRLAFRRRFLTPGSGFLALAFRRHRVCRQCEVVTSVVCKVRIVCRGCGGK